MKQLIIKSLEIKPENTPSNEYLVKLNAIKRYMEVLELLNLNSEVVALISNNYELQEIFKTSCILKGVNFTIVNQSGLDELNLVNLGVSIVFLDKTNWEVIPEYILETTPVKLLLDAHTCRIDSAKEGYKHIIYPLHSYLNADFIVSLTWDEAMSFIVSHTETHKHSTEFAIHPGISSWGSKVSVFNEERLAKGLYKVVDELYSKIEDLGILPVNKRRQPIVNITIFESPSFPYVYTNGTFLAMFSNGSIAYNKFSKESQVLFISTDTLTRLMENIIDNSIVLSFLSKYRMNFLLKILFKRAFNKETKGLRLVILYGKTTKKLRTLLNHTKKTVLYMYNLTEVSSFVGFEVYKKLPIKTIPTVGVLPREVVLNNGSSGDKPSEILLNLPDQFCTYTNDFLKQLCSMSEQFIGMHGTLDIGKNVNGKLQVIGKADELFVNEHGLTIQTDLIASIALDNRYIRDVLFAVSKSSMLVLIVELKLSRLLQEELTAKDCMEELNKTLLPKINNTVFPYSRVSRIILIPGGFERINGKIKLSNYSLLPR